MAAPKLCKANVGTRKQPRACGKPIANGMRAACKDHATTLIPTGESKIYYRGGSYVVVTVHRGKQRKTFHPSIGLAREARGDRTGTNKQVPQSRQPFDRYALQWIDSYQGRTGRGFDDDTRAAYKRALELYAIPHFGSTPLRDTDRERVGALIAKLQRQGLRASTIAKYLTPVRALFSDAVENGKLATNPAAKLRVNAKAASTRTHSRVTASEGSDKVQSSDPQRVKDMTRAELAAALAAIPESRDRLFFEVLTRTGCRISEALGLDWSDLGEDGATLRIERQWYRGKLKRYTKTSNGRRTISLPPGLARKLWAIGADASGPMFHTCTGRRLSDRNCNRVLERVETAAGLPHISAHSFRHTHGSILLDAGWPITDVAHRLGDDVQTVAKTYAHKMRDSQRDLGFLDDLGAAEASDDASRGQRIGHKSTRNQPQIAGGAYTTESLD